MNIVNAVIKVLEYRLEKQKEYLKKALDKEDYWSADKHKHTHDELMEVCDDLKDLIK